MMIGLVQVMSHPVCADNSSSSSSRGSKMSTKGQSVREKYWSDSRNEPSSISENHSSISPGSKMSTKGQSIRDNDDDDDEEAGFEPSSSYCAEKDSSARTSCFKDSQERASLRDDDGSCSRNEPSSIAENHSSSSFRGSKMSTKGQSVRDNDDNDDEEAGFEPSSSNRAEMDSSTRTSFFKNRQQRASLRDDDGSGSRNEPSSIAENNSSSSSCGFKMSTKGHSVRELSSNEEMEEEENGNDDQENEVEASDPESSGREHRTIRQTRGKPGPSTSMTYWGQPKRLQKLSEEQSRLLKSLFKTKIALRK